jgi:HSP20 family molecular chaperone IbpA
MFGGLSEFAASLFDDLMCMRKKVETEKVEANLQDGVLSLRISKREGRRPRKIEVRIG